MNALDEKFLARAADLAENGLYTAAPNPRVGCVVVRGGRIVGEGWHLRAGENHAEVNALNAAGAAARGAAVYVSLEPCAHFGKTPPCTEALIKAGVKKTFIALPDPNPQAAGGAEKLRAAGIAVCFAPPNSPARQRAAELNAGFICRVTTGLPLVRLKIAATLDGKTALESGLSKWISNEESRRDAHRLRARSCAVITGSGTAKTDNPALTARDVCAGRQPLRVLVDSNLRAAPTLTMLQENCLVAAAVSPPPNYPAEVATLADARGKVDLAALLRELGRRQMNEVTVEAGRKLNGALLAAGLVDEIVLYIAPRAFGGGKDILQFPADAAPATPDAAPQFVLRQVSRLGDDVKLVYRKNVLSR